VNARDYTESWSSASFIEVRRDDALKPRISEVVGRCAPARDNTS